MKNLSWKKFLIGILLPLVFILIRCSSPDDKSMTYINPAFGKFISSYTAGVVSSGTTIRVVLAEAVADSSAIGKESNDRLFSFSPAIKGTTFWVDERTIEFRPSSRLPSGQVYKADFLLSRLKEVEDELKTFSFSFQVIPQDFEVSIDNVKPYVNTELTRQRIEGTVTTADYAEPQFAETMVAAEQDGNALEVTWAHDGDGRAHRFVVENVSRKESKSQVNLVVRGKALNLDKTVEQEIAIPSLGDFKLVNARVVQSPSQYVILQFSDPLLENQNFNGLISIQEVTDLDFTVRDNEVWVYPSVRQTGTKTVTVASGLRNILNFRMENPASMDVVFEQVKPAVRFVRNGSILPGTNGLVLPFEGVNLRAVDVDIFKVYEDNVLQFLQNNSLDGRNELRRVGKRILKKRISLDNTGVTDLGKWNRFTLNLADLIRTEEGAIYQVRISFKKAYSTFDCGEPVTTELEPLVVDDDIYYETDDDFAYWDSYDDYYYDSDYDWQQRDNPCSNSYYSYSRRIVTNLIASDLGIIAKRGDDGNTFVMVTDLKAAAPMSGVSIQLYNFQQQVIATGSTGSDGMVTIRTKEVPFVVAASQGSQHGYLKLSGGEALSLSNFDVSGEAVRGGMKGFLYGERGVWRPGDSLYLAFMLEDRDKLLPANYPVVFELHNPQGQIVRRLVESKSENGFYNFSTATDPEAITGNYTARVKAGGTEYSRVIKIETVKPNRLRINLDFGVDRFTSPSITGNLEVKWLHGAPGRNLKAEFDVLLTPMRTAFDGYQGFVFTDPAIDFYSETQQVFEGYTNSEGKATVNARLETSMRAPGFLNAVFRGKAFEESGNFSIDNFSIPFSPYVSYTGIKLPEGRGWSQVIPTDTTHRVEIVTVDPNGKPISRNNVEVSLYKLQWRWWWDRSASSTANYIESSYTQLISEQKIHTSNGRGAWSFRMQSAEWGRYYVKVCDPVSGHCTGGIFYVDQPGWYSRRSGDDERGGATMLSFSADKEVYQVGEQVNLTIPGSNEGKALVSIENGSKVVKTYWIETQAGESRFSFGVTPDMAPNVYVNIALIQPHAQTTNDLPIRMYGVIPVRVEDPNTKLQPVITMPAEMEPGKEVKIQVSESTKRKMTYTLAVVDEGLLDITRFRTPDPWNRFYAREALGVKTWDLYDDVIGAFGAKIERLLAVGGDEELQAKEDDSRANRFKPVVKFFGPVTLEPGKTNTHTFVMPQYIGSVKAMVVAGYEGAYGNAEKTAPVRKPLMVLATLPRVLGPEEKVKLPVTLFTQEQSIRNVTVAVKVSGPVSLSGSSSRNVTMDASGELTVDFDLDVKAQTGVAKVEVTATSGSFSSSDAIEIEVRNPNLPVTRTLDALVETGREWQTDFAPIGMAGSNTGILEVSSIPPVNLGSRLRYLFQYPYGCIEQTTSSVFPQLYLDQIKVLTEAERLTVQRNVAAGIERLKLFLLRDGSFAYWPGNAQADSWGTTYAGHFLAEAEAKGYYVPSDMLSNWKKYQRAAAASWRRNTQYYNNDLMQAYRLYALAVAGSAELGAMNRLREMTGLSSTAAWMLAAAYVRAGQPEAARALISTLTLQVPEYRELGYTYGSDIRDRALILETLSLLGDRTRGFELLKQLSEALSNENRWLSTQEIAFSLKAISSFVGNERGELKFAYAINGGSKTNASTQLPIAQISVPVEGVANGKVSVANQSSGMLYARLILEGTPTRGTEEAASSNLILTVDYKDTKGNSVDPTTLEQGTEFVAEVTVIHPGVRSRYENLALSQVFPSGWEINNLRLSGDEDFLENSAFTYQDIHDDRVYTFFDLAPRERKTFRIMLTASYAGTFYLPSAQCEAMYDRSIYARKTGQEVVVTKSKTTP